MFCNENLGRDDLDINITNQNVNTNSNNTVAVAEGVALNFCPNCGTKTNGSNFCSNCGAKLK